MTNSNHNLHNSFTPRLAAALSLFALNSAFLLMVFGFGFNLPFYLVVLVISLALSVMYPAAGLMSALALTIVFAKQYTLQPVVIGQTEYKFFLLDILLVGSYVGLFIQLLAGKLRWRWRATDWLLALFIVLTAVYAVLSVVFWSGQTNLVISSLKNYGYYPLVFFAVYLAFDSREKIKELLVAASFACSFIIGFLTYGIIMGQGLWTEITPLSTEGSRLLDFDHAFYLGLAILGGLVYWLYGRSRSWRTLWLWLLPIYAFGVAASLMRHLWLAIGAGIVALIWLAAKDKLPLIRNILFTYTLIGSMILALLLLMASLWPTANWSHKLAASQSSLVERATSITDSSDSSIAWRGYVWQSVWDSYSQRSLLGMGFGQKVFVEMPDYLDYVEVRNIHNSFLAIFVQTGVLVFTIFLAFLWLMFKNLVKAAKGAWRPLNIAITAMLCFSLVAFLFQPYLEANFFSFIFWLILGLGRRTYEGNIS